MPCGCNFSGGSIRLRCRFRFCLRFGFARESSHPGRRLSLSLRAAVLGDLLDAKQLARPKLMKWAYPSFVDLPDGHDVQRIHPPPSVFARLHQIRLAQHVKMLHHPKASQMRKRLHNLGCGPRTISQKIQDCPPRRIGQRLPHSIELVRGMS